MIGAGLGAYTQDPLDHPIAAAVGAGIGGYAASVMSYHSYIKPVASVSKRISVQNQDIKIYGEKINNRLVEIEARLNGYEAGLTSPRSKIRNSTLKAMTAYKEHLKVVAGNIDTVMSNQFGLSILNGAELDSPAGREAMRSFVNSQLTDSPALKMLHSTMGFDSTITLADLKVSANLQKAPSFKISSTTSAVDAERMIREFLINQLGHGGELAKAADLKAKVLSSKLAGLDYSVSENGLSVTANGRTEMIPLTGYDKNGTRYTKVGGVKQGVMSFNPFAGNYLGRNDVEAGTVLETLLGRTGRVTAEDVLRQYDPELRLAFADFSNGNHARVLSSVASSIRSDSEYLSAAAHGDLSSVGKMERLSTQVTPYKVDKKGKLVPLSRVATNKHSDPEIRQLGEFLTSETGRNIYSGVNVNSIGAFNASTDGQYYAGLFPPMERGADTVLDRGYYSTGADNELSKLLGISEHDLLNQRKYAGLSNAVVLNRLDVDDELSRFASNLFGSHVSLDDGAGLFNEMSNEKLSVVQNVTLEIGSTKDGKFMLTADLAKINDLMRDGADRDKALKFFARNKIQSGVSIGFDGLGAPVKLGKEYTHGEVVDAFVEDGRLKISIKAEYRPEEWVKVFSTATKSGLTRLRRVEFETLTGIENLRRQGLIKINPDMLGFTTSDGSKWDIDDLRTAIKLGVAQNQDNPFQKHKMDVDIISRASDTGTELIEAARRNDLNVLNKYIGRFQESAKSSGTISDALDFLTSKDASTRTSAAKFLLAISDNKANSDMYLTGLHEASGDAISIMDLQTNQQNLSAGLLSKDKNVRENALTDILNAYLNSEDTGIVKTTATVDLGGALRGVGNEGRISWNEQLNLKMNGWTQDDLSKIGSRNADALYELAMVESRVERGADYRAQKLKYGERIPGVFKKSAGGRIADLEAMGMKQNASGFVHYGLETEMYGIKSIAIPTRDTNLSGLLDIDGRQLLKQMDVYRQAVIMADINLARVADNKGSEAYKSAFSNYKDAIASYAYHANKMFSGDNNLMKNAMRMESDVSVIHNFRSADGDFAALTESQMDSRGKLMPNIAMSEEGLSRFMKDVGIDDYELSRVHGFNNVYRVTVPEFEEIMHRGKKRKVKRYKGYHAMITREPVQGPLSSYIANVYVDKSIKEGEHQVFIPKIQKDAMKSVSATYQFADFDADAGRITSLHNLSSSAKERLLRVQNMMLETASQISDLQKAMGSKAAENHFVTLAKFSAPIDYEKYLAAGAQKGKVRKLLAPFATDIATNMNAALDRHLKSLNLEADELVKRSMTGRSVIHNLVENLLKTQHQKTDPSAMSAITEMEQLLHAHSELLSDGDKAGYKTRATSVFDKILGAKVNKNGNAASKMAYNTAVGDITEGVSRYASQIDAEGWEQKHGRFTGSASANSVDRYIKAVSANGMLPHEINESLESNIESFMKNAKGYMEYAKNLASDNKRIIGLAAIGLGATAAFIGSERPELSKETLPIKDKNAILQPIPDEKGYVTKGRDYRASGKTFNVQASNNNGNPRQKTRELFQDKSRSNVIIKDKRER